MLEKSSAISLGNSGKLGSRAVPGGRGGAPTLRARIKNELFQAGLYPPGWFSLICGFQVFDHLTRPNEVLRTCRELLAPGGLVLFIHHDAGAWTNRFLGERSPIIDIEHTYSVRQENRGADSCEERLRNPAGIYCTECVSAGVLV